MGVHYIQQNTLIQKLINFRLGVGEVEQINNLFINSKE